MADNKALRPDFFGNLPTLIKEKQAKEKGISDEEQFLYSLSQTAGWRELRKYIDSLMTDLENHAEAGIAQGLSFEEIGKNTIVVNLAKGVIRNIINKVEDAREAAEKPDGTLR